MDTWAIQVVLIILDILFNLGFFARSVTIQ
jgi:hypothetical protein